MLPSLRERDHPVVVLVALPPDPILGTARDEAIRKVTHFVWKGDRERMWVRSPMHVQW
jgi:hypothetical protein